jgi:hypothetical protein
VIGPSHTNTDVNERVVRSGAFAALLGVGVLLIATLSRPSNSDPNDSLAAFAEYANDHQWFWSHLGQFIGFVLLSWALNVAARTFEPGPSLFGEFSRIGATAMVAIAAVLQAVDGVALKRAVDRLAINVADVNNNAFATALAIRDIEIGLAALLSITTGLTLVSITVGIFTKNNSKGSLLVACSVLSTSLMLISGVTQAIYGFSQTAMNLSMAASGTALAFALTLAVELLKIANGNRAP